MKYRKFTTKELVWIRKFQRLMKQAPDSLFMFVGSGSVVIYPTDEHGQQYMKENGCVDGDAPDMQIPTDMICAGGDW